MNEAKEACLPSPKADPRPEIRGVIGSHNDVWEFTEQHVRTSSQMFQFSVFDALQSAITEEP